MWLSRLENITYEEIGHSSSTLWVMTSLRKGDRLCPKTPQKHLSGTSADVHAGCCNYFVDILLTEVIPKYVQSGSQKWRDVNVITLKHPILGDSVVGCLFAETFPIGGCSYTVKPGDRQWGQSVGMIFDMFDMERSLYSFPGGDSEQITDPSSRSMLSAWRDGKYIPMIPHFDDNSDDHLVFILKPK